MKWPAALFSITALLTVGAAPVIAQHDITEFEARSIRVLGNSAVMHSQQDYWVTSATGPIGSKGIPETIRLGDAITVNDRTVMAKHIYASRCNRRIEGAGKVLCEDGHTSCVVVEKPEDRPSDQVRNRLWIHVKNCAPVE